MELIGDTRYKYLKNKNDIAKINNQNHLLVGMTEIQLSKTRNYLLVLLVISIIIGPFIRGKIGRVIHKTRLK